MILCITGSNQSVLQNQLFARHKCSALISLMLKFYSFWSHHFSIWANHVPLHNISWFVLLYLLYRFPWWLSGKVSVCQCMKCRFNSWVGKISWKRKWQPTPVFLPGKSHWQRSLVGFSARLHLSSYGIQWWRKAENTQSIFN